MTEDIMLNGTFQKKSFPTLLAEIRETGKTGILVAQKGQIVKRAFFQNGEPIASRSNIKKELLGEILCTRGKISRAQLDEVILESQKESGDSFGRIITQKGILSQGELYANTKYQFIAILFSLFAWEEGTYSIEEREAAGLVPPGLPRFHVKFSKLISEGIRQVRKEGFIDRALGRTDQVLKLTDVSYQSEELSFQGVDREVIDVLAEGMTVQEVIDSVSVDPDLAKKILYTLSNLGVLQIQGPVEPEAKEKEKEKEKGEKTAEEEASATNVDGVQEEIPQLDQTSLASVMDDLIPESAEGEEGPLPSFDEEPIAETGLAPDEEEEELLPPQDGIEEDETAEDVSELIDAAVDEAAEAGAEEPAETEELEVEESEVEESTDGEEAELTASSEEEAAMEEESMVPEEEEEEPETERSLGDETELAAPAAAEEGSEEKETPEEEVLDVPSEEEVPEEEVASEVKTTKEEVEAEEDVLTPDQEAVLEEAVEKEAEEAAETEEVSREDVPLPEEGGGKKKKKWPLLVGIPVIVLVLLFGAMALFYAQKAREIRTGQPTASVPVPPAEQVEQKTPQEIINELAKNKAVAKEPVSAIPEEAKSPAKSTVTAETVPGKTVNAVPPVQKPPVNNPPVSKPAPGEKMPSPPESVPVGEVPAGITAQEEVPPSVSVMKEPWENAYNAGLASFNDGNLESAFSNWADVIRNAPDDTYSIQIELTFYLNYAARDIREAGAKEKVFIVESSLNEKPVYKVLCGIYPGRPAAEAAFRDLTPYLKAQHPYVMSVSRLKAKLKDSTP